MEAPPPYMPPRKKSNTGLIIGLVIGGLVLCCIAPIAVLGGLGLWGFNKVKPLIECSATMSVARDALKDYAKDHNGKLPPAENWMEEVRKYYAQEMNADQTPFKAMAASAVWGCDDGSGGKTGIAYNSELAGKAVDDVKGSEVVLFEVRQATANAAQKYVAGGFSDSPKLFNEHRGWFVAFMEGEPGFYDQRDQFVPMNARGSRRR
ncbi:MAG: hypothetical protein ACHQ50_07895 [Fimbriimonadales bacterium]